MVRLGSAALSRRVPCGRPCGGWVSQGDPGFEHDIMGTGIGFSPVHTENFGNYILGQESSKGSKFILDRFVDLDESGNLIGGEPIKKP